MTGAAGFVGSAVVRHGIELGHEVHAIRRPGGQAQRLDGVDCPQHDVDLLDLSGLGRLIARVRPTVVVHAASAPGHGRDPGERLELWRGNLQAVVTILETLRAADSVTFVHVGSSTEYAPSDQPHHEDEIGVPKTARGASKLASTIAVRQWALETGRPTVVLRPFSVYGPREQPFKLIPTLLRCAVTGVGFPMLDQTSRRDLVHVQDVARACLRSASVASSAAPVINVGTGVEHSVDEVRRLVETVTRRPVHVGADRRSPQAHDVEHWVADTARCRQLLDWVPEISLEDGIASLVADEARGRDGAVSGDHT